tara:strand:+ start:4775 stop:4960 length:186 start_codon:yes stop_codon:yes gene_type:complete
MITRMVLRNGSESFAFYAPEGSHVKVQEWRTSAGFTRRAYQGGAVIAEQFGTAPILSGFLS